MTAFDPAFVKAREKCECEFVFCLLRVKGLQDPGWEPYETTKRAIPVLLETHKQMGDTEAARHLQLWLYGHIVEASEPYEILYNLISVSLGHRYSFSCFPDRPNGRPQSPGEKIKEIEKIAHEANMSEVSVPLREIWNRELRNAVFHSDYSFHGPEIRVLKGFHNLIYSHEEIMTLVNRALAYYKALSILDKMHREGYVEPKTVQIHPDFSSDTSKKAIIIVREGYGATGIKSAWTRAEAGGIMPFLIGRFFSKEEMTLLESDPTLAKLPPIHPES